MIELRKEDMLNVNGGANFNYYDYWNNYNFYSGNT